MVYYFSQPWDQDPRLALLDAADLSWVGSPAAAAEENDDWSGVVGDCHALRPAAGAPDRGAALDEGADWGYHAHAI